MRIKGYVSGKLVDLNVDTIELRRDYLALQAPKPTDHDVKLHGHNETAKAKANDSYIMQSFDYEKFRYDWADKMIAASEKGDSK